MFKLQDRLGAKTKRNRRWATEFGCFYMAGIQMWFQISHGSHVKIGWSQALLQLTMKNRHLWVNELHLRKKTTYVRLLMKKKGFLKKKIFIWHILNTLTIEIL
jgi:hypothetical protein